MPPFLSGSNILQLLATYNLADLVRGVLYPAPFNIVAKTASYTILPTDKNGTIFSNRGAAGAVTFTLPGATAVPAGTWFEFIGIVAQNIIVASAAIDTLLTLNDVAADSIAMQTAGQIIGARLKVVNDGTQWIATGETVGVTYTVAT